MARFNELLGSEFTASWRFARDDDRFSLVDVSRSNTFVDARYFTTLSEGLRSGEMGFAFSTHLPEAAQRNTPMHFRSARETLNGKVTMLRTAGLARSAYARLLPPLERTIALHDSFGIADHRQLRTLICDGPLVLCYLNAIQESPFTPRQRYLYTQAAALLGRRNRLDHQLSSMAGLRGALDVALAALGRAAYILDVRGVAVHANALGIDALERDPFLSACLADPRARELAGYDAMPIDVAGLPKSVLVTRRYADLRELAMALADEVHLGERARDVFALAAAGESTKSIASRLVLAENTVEYHLTVIYRRLGVGSRAEMQQALLERALQRGRS